MRECVTPRSRRCRVLEASGAEELDCLDNDELKEVVPVAMARKIRQLIRI
jgi:hypothetical protein